MSQVTSQYSATHAVLEQVTSAAAASEVDSGMPALSRYV